MINSDKVQLRFYCNGALRRNFVNNSYSNLKNWQRLINANNIIFMPARQIMLAGYIFKV